MASVKQSPGQMDNLRQEQPQNLHIVKLTLIRVSEIIQFFTLGPMPSQSARSMALASAVESPTKRIGWSIVAAM